MKSTVLIPIKSSLSTLKECLKSLEEQDQSFIEEVIIIENGSNDVKDLKSSLPLRLVHLKEGNRSKARNIGAKLAKTPLLIFLDADIVLNKDWVKKVSEAFDIDTLAVQTSIVPKSKTNNLLQRIRKSRVFFNNNYSFLSLNKENPEKLIINSAAFAMRRETFESLEGFDENLIRHEDLDFTQRLIRKCKGELVSLSCTNADVYFSGSIFRYYLREFDCGLHIVRYHEKWSSTHISESLYTLKSNYLNLIKKLKSLDPRNDLNVHFFFLEAFYLLGNFTGIFKKMAYPYPGKQMDDLPVLTKVVFK